LDPVDPVLNKMTVETIHNEVMEAIAAKGKIVYDIRPDKPVHVYKTIAFNVRKRWHRISRA